MVHLSEDRHAGKIQKMHKRKMTCREQERICLSSSGPVFGEKNNGLKA